MEEAKYKSLKDEYEVHKEKVKQTICELQRKVLLLGEEKSALKKQITQVREETSKGSAIAVKIMQEEIDSLKKGKQSAEEAYNKQILALEETFAWTVSQVECKLAQQRLDFDAQKSKQDKDNLKQRQESELTRLKYENIVKMNNMLLGEVEMLKGKANQVTLKEKYKDKIAGLFMN